MEIFPTTSAACPDKCPCVVHVENGKVVKVTGHPDSPLNQGFPKPHSYAIKAGTQILNLCIIRIEFFIQ